MSRIQDHMKLVGRRMIGPVLLTGLTVLTAPAPGAPRPRQQPLH